MWKLYDELCTGIPSGIKIDGCVIGKTLVSVRANGHIGMARLLEAPARTADGLRGAYLRDTANHTHWRSLTDAAIGVAAMNAFYNTAERVGSLEANGASAAAPYAELAGKSLALVGDCPFFEASGLKALRLPLPMAADFDENGYEELKKADLVVISADALTTRALPALLDIVGEGGSVAVEGVSAPASALFFAFNMPVKMISGVYQSFDGSFEEKLAGDLQLDPCVSRFCVKPQHLTPIHESEAAKEMCASPYRASKFNPLAF